MKADLSGKIYTNLSTASEPTRVLHGSAMINITNKIAVGAEGSRMIHQDGSNSGSGFLGVSVDKFGFAVGDAGTEGDLKLSVGAGVWVFVGGEAELEINLSEVGRRIEKDVILPMAKKYNEFEEMLSKPETWYQLINEISR